MNVIELMDEIAPNATIGESLHIPNSLIRDFSQTVAKSRLVCQPYVNRKFYTLRFSYGIYFDPAPYAENLTSLQILLFSMRCAITPSEWESSEIMALFTDTLRHLFFTNKRDIEYRSMFVSEINKLPLTHFEIWEQNCEWEKFIFLESIYTYPDPEIANINVSVVVAQNNVAKLFDFVSQPILCPVPLC